MKKLILALALALSLLMLPLNAFAASTDLTTLEKQVHKLQQKVISLESEVKTLKEENTNLNNWYNSIKAFLEIKTGINSAGQEQTFLSINSPMIWNATLEGLTSFRKDANGYSDLKTFYSFVSLLSEKVSSIVK